MNSKRGEIWKPILGYEGLYEVSNFGRVITLKRNGVGQTHLLSSNSSNRGTVVSLIKDKKSKVYRVGELVVRAFYTIFDPHIIIHHIDRDPNNDCLFNLSYEIVMKDCDNEQWKVVEGFSDFAISSRGRMLNCRLNILMKPYEDEFGYMWFRIRQNGVESVHPVHRFVAEAFILNSENKPQVNHIDGNKHNNCIANLEWVTGSENVRHAFANGLIKEKSAQAKRNIAEAARRTLKKRCNIGIVCTTTGQKFDSFHEAALFYGVDDTTIQALVRGQTKNSRKLPGLHFAFEDPNVTHRTRYRHREEEE